MKDVTPEEIFKKFIKEWREGNHRAMYELTQKTWQSKNQDIPALFQTGKPKVSSLTLSRIAFSPTSCDLQFSFIESTHAVSGSVRLIKEKAPYKPDKKGEWGINPISFRSRWKRLE